MAKLNCEDIEIRLFMCKFNDSFIISNAFKYLEYRGI